MKAREIVCPVSFEKVDERASRVGAGLMAALTLSYALTGFWPLLAFVVVDFGLRVFTNCCSPVARFGRWTVARWGGEARLANKGPKMFAWRVGLLMSVLALALLPVAPTASAVVAGVLGVFTLLDGLLGFCVGCVLYTYVVAPRFDA